MNQYESSWSHGSFPLNGHTATDTRVWGSTGSITCGVSHMITLGISTLSNEVSEETSHRHQKRPRGPHYRKVLSHDQPAHDKPRLRSITANHGPTVLAELTILTSKWNPNITRSNYLLTHHHNTASHCITSPNVTTRDVSHLVFNLSTYFSRESRTIVASTVCTKFLTCSMLSAV